MAAIPAQPDRPVVTRYAPSPTGPQHIGGMRTALFSWAFARQHRGKFILRIEDTDLKRSSPESTRGIIRDLRWLGFDWDEGPKWPCEKPGCDCGSAESEYDPYMRQVGEHGPYFQSQRAEQGIYDKYIALLLDAGEAYEDNGAVRLKMGAHRGDIAFDDAVYGPISVKAADLEDFVIRKGEDGGHLPTFHFAVVIDDALMEVTHVIRGQEHLTNTSKHAAIYDALAKVTGDAETWRRPVWVHTPSIMNPGGSKMSKRDKAKAAREAALAAIGGINNFQARDSFIDKVIRIDSVLQSDIPFNRNEKQRGLADISYEQVSDFLSKGNDENRIAVASAEHLRIALPEIEVDDFRKSGYLPAALLNYIALLGWNPGDNIERFDLGFLIEKFSLDRIGKANSTFDRDKLKHFNAESIRALPPDEFAHLLGDYVKTYRPDWAHAGVFKGDDWPAFCAAVQERTHTLPDALDMNAYLIAEDDAIEYDFSPKPVRKAMAGNDGEGVRLLKQIRGVLAGLPDDGFGHAAHEAMNTLAQASGVNVGKVAQPIRVAVSGSMVTPPIDVTLELLGKQSTLERIDRCLAAARQATA